MSSPEPLFDPIASVCVQRLCGWKQVNGTFDALNFPAYVVNVDDYLVKLVKVAAYISQQPKNLTCYVLTHDLNRSFPEYFNKDIFKWFYCQ
ncbi:hypothetical protein KAR91_04475 [Candidatus Pacearchaeota archaeon]|nr:hypothetical protein [Candidatus Pacearchaeota archaeon]